MGCGGSTTTHISNGYPSERSPQTQTHLNKALPPSQPVTEPSSTLSPPVKPDGPISHYDIHINNSSRGQESWWFPYHNKVYDAMGILNATKSFLEEHCEDAPEKGVFLNDMVTTSSPYPRVMINLERMKLLKARSTKENVNDEDVEEAWEETPVDAAVEMFCMGDLKVSTEEEQNRTTREELQELRAEVSRDRGEETSTLRIVTDRHLGHLHSKSCLVQEGNPNEAIFPLPSGIDPSTLRDSLDDLPPLNFDIDGDSAWQMADEPLKLDLGDAEEVWEKHIMADHNGEPFDMEIEGEVAWESVAEGLVSEDVTTEEQDSVWKAREKRTDLEDPARMARRRQELRNYLREKYDNLDTDKLEQCQEWADRMEASRKKFEELCQ